MTIYFIISRDLPDSRDGNNFHLRHCDRGCPQSSLFRAAGTPRPGLAQVSLLPFIHRYDYNSYR